MAFKGWIFIYAVVFCILPCQAFFRPNVDFSKKYVPEVADKNIQMISEAKQLITILENRIKQIYQAKNQSKSVPADPCRRLKRGADDLNATSHELVKWLVKRCTENVKNYEDLVRLG